MKDGGVYDATYLSQDDATWRYFVRLPSGNTCWIPAERAIDYVEQ